MVSGFKGITMCGKQGKSLPTKNFKDYSYACVLENHSHSLLNHTRVRETEMVKKCKWSICIYTAYSGATCLRPTCRCNCC